MKMESMDVVRFLIRKRCAIVINKTFSVSFKGKCSRIKMTEDSHAPMCISVRSAEQSVGKSFRSSESDSIWGDDYIGV